MNEPLFEDVVLPLFDQPVPVVEPERSKKQQDDDAHKISYRRYRVHGRTNCDDCVAGVVNQEQTGISDASYVRVYRGDSRFLCFRHKTEQEHRDQLNGKA